MYKRVKLIFSGIFVVPATGTWRVSYSLWSTFCTLNDNTVNLYHQGLIVEEMVFNSVADTNCGWSTGGRETFFHAEKEETFHLFATSVDNNGLSGLRQIMICFEYLDGPPTTTTLSSSSVTPQSSMEKKIKEMESTLNNTITYVQSLEKELGKKNIYLTSLSPPKSH